MLEEPKTNIKGIHESGSSVMFEAFWSWIEIPKDFSPRPISCCHDGKQTSRVGFESGNRKCLSDFVEGHTVNAYGASS